MKLIDLPNDLRIELPIKNKMVSIPLETEFGTIVRNIRLPERKIGEDFLNSLIENIEPQSGNVVIPMDFEGEEWRVTIPKELIDKTKMLLDKLK